MYWNSVSDFLNMGGYGLYVWGSFGAALVCMLVEPVLVVQRRRRALSQAAEGDYS